MPIASVVAWPVASCMLLACGALAAQAEPATVGCGERNYIRLDGRAFRYLTALYTFPAAERPAEGAGRVLAAFPVEALLGDRVGRQRARDLRVVDGRLQRRPFHILRGDRPVGPVSALRAGDSLRVAFTHEAGTPQAIGLFLLSGAGALPVPQEYRPIDAAGAGMSLSYTVNDWQRGLLDTTGLVDLRQPASRIQLDLLYSARWNLWYEFAHWTQMPTAVDAVPPLLCEPFNQLAERSHFNMDDVPRFPLYYLRYYRATGDRDALRRARQGLQAILDTVRPDGAMPYMLYPWNGKHSEPGQLVDTYHSMRALAEGIPAFKRDRAFAAKLRAGYDLLRSFARTKMVNGLFFGRASGNAALIEAAYHRRLDTHAERDLQDIRTLADAMLTPEGRSQMSDFGENMPWAPLGLAWAARATGDARYLREADLWLDKAVIPSLKLDRRYYTALPDLKPSGPKYGENPLSIWYHTDALLTLYRITGNKRYYDLAVWVYGDYYDLKRYGERSGARIVDTGDPETERWGSASAEDALRMVAKYLWQRQYPSIYADSRARRDDKTGPAAAASPVRPN